jgi:benzoyl-CoA 2,3-dioxygenase component B
MLTEEAHHMFVGETGVTRIIRRTLDEMQKLRTDDPEVLRKAGVMDLPLIQRYINFWFSSALDLFGAEISSNAATYFANGLKGRPDEGTYEDHDCSDSFEDIETPEGLEKVATRNAMNFITRSAYVRDCGIGLTRWNRTIAKAGFDIELKLPSERFNRHGGVWSGMAIDTEGKPCSPEAVIAALPSMADRAYVKSLMVGVTQPGQCANWTSPPDRGINNMAFEFDYVRAA